RAIVGRARAHLWREAAHGLEVVIENLGPSGEYRFDGGIAVEGNGHEDFHDNRGGSRSHRFDGPPEMLSTAIGQIVASDGRNDHVFETHAAGCFGDALWFIGFK